jgi:peptidoglycan/LPS O-acetylase OafA/YrhL
LTGHHPQIRRIAGIDGLRALAVFAVMLFHADYAWGRGGYLGVDVFFVVSGFLITRILLQQLERDGAISFVHFFERRARRILPAMLAVVGGTAIACQFLRPDALPALRSDAFASMLLMANWHFVINGIDYFEKFEGHQMLQHLWSLAVEEQFYLFWPLAVLAVAARWGRFALGLFAGGLALASAVWMGWFARSLGFPESMAMDRVYLGTDTHSVGLLVGAVLACSQVRISTFARKLKPGTSDAIAALFALASLAGIVGLVTSVGENHSLLYPFAFVATSLCAAGLIMGCLLSPGCGAALDVGPLKWIGERSYGVYLWHWPVFALTRPGLDLDLSQDQTFMLRFLITLALSATSYHVIEAPILSRSEAPAKRRPRLAWVALGGAVVWGASILAIPTHPDALAEQQPTAVADPAPAFNGWPRAAMRSMLQPYDLGTWQSGTLAARSAVPREAAAKNASSGIQSTVETDPFGSEAARPGADWSGFVAFAIASRMDLGISRTAGPPPASAKALTADPPDPAASADPENTAEPKRSGHPNKPSASAVSARSSMPGASLSASTFWDGRAYYPLRSEPDNLPSQTKPSAAAAAANPLASTLSERQATDTRATSALSTPSSTSAAAPASPAPPRFPGSTASPTSPASVVGLASSVASAPSAGGAPAGSPYHVRARGEASSLRALTLIGDSVLLGARVLIERSIAGAVVHAEVGWQAADVLRTVQRVRDAGELHPCVVIHLGTNGYITEKQLRAILDLLDDRQQVLVVNSRVPKRWMAANNALLEAVVPSYPNAVLVDWFGLSDPRSEYFVSDGVHLTSTGIRAFVAALTAEHQLAQAR